MNTILYIFLALILLVFVVSIIVKFTFVIKGIKKEIRYLDIEIERTEGKERERWKKKKRQLLLSLIPFIKNS